MSMVLAAGSSLANATEGQAESYIADALSVMRGNQQITFQIAGTELIGNKTRYFSTNVFFQPELTGPAKLEIDEYEIKGEQTEYVNRVVGDGKSLWTYDMRRAKYSSVTYGFDTETRPKDVPNTTTAVLNLVYAKSSGATSYAVRLLREIFAGDSTRYQAWAPGCVAVEAPFAPAPGISDLLVAGRTYNSRLDSNNVVIQRSIVYGPLTYQPTRFVAFRVDYDPASGSPSLGLINFAERNTTRVVDWALIVSPGIQAAPAGLFRPYTLEALAGWINIRG